MKYTLSIYCLLLIFSVTSCKKKIVTDSVIAYQKKNSAIFNDSLTLKEMGTTSFPLDKQTPLISNSIQFTDSKEGGLFSDLNFFNSTIYVYSYKTRSLIKKICIAKGTFLGNPQYFAHYLKNLDTIFVTHSWTSTVLQIDSSGKVVSKGMLAFPGPGKFIVGIDAKTRKPMQLKGDTLLIPGHLLDLNVEDQRQIKNLILYNFKTKDSNRIFDRPDLFNYGSWGGAPYELFVTYNKLSGKLVEGYAAEPYLYETDWDGNVTGKHYLGSKFFEKILPYGAKKYKNANAPVEEFEKHDDISPRFGQVIYDPYNNLYYRFVVLPLTEEEYIDPRKRFYHKESIIITNSRFQKIGEVLLPEKRYKTDMSFVAPDGLHLALLPELQHNDDSLVFVNLKIERK